MKMQYVLQEKDGSVIFCVLWMDERFRCFDTSTSFVCTSNLKQGRFIVSSSGAPGFSLYKTRIYLRGGRTKDDFNYSTTSASSILPIEVIDSNFKEWATKWDGWYKDIFLPNDYVPKNPLSDQQIAEALSDLRLKCRDHHALYSAKLSVKTV